MKFFSILLLLTSIIAYASPFQNIDNWSNPYPGIWSADIGDTKVEQSWTELAAEPPRANALNSLTKIDFPFTKKRIQVIKTDGRIGFSIPTAMDSKVYGFGLQFNGVEHSQNTLNLKVDHWGTGGGRSHAPCPFFFTTDGYGIFIDTARYVRVRTHISVRKDAEDKPQAIDRNPVGGFKEGMTRWTSMPKASSIEADLHGKGARIYVIAGKTPLDIVARYNLLNGGGALPPLWGLGIWHRVPADFDAEQTLTEIQQFKEHNIPLDVIGLEPGWMTASYPCSFEWQKERFADPKAFTQSLLTEHNIRLNLWENPYVAPSARIYEPLSKYSSSHLVWNGIVPDLKTKKGTEILIDQHEKDHISIGISGYKTDEVDGYDKWLWPDHAVFPSGTPAESMRQIYGTLYQKTYYDQLYKKNNRRTYALVRSMGGAASAHPSVLYSDSYDHKEYITGISAASLTGHLWCPEIRSADTPLEWIRRSQSVAFSPMAMINAWASGAKPWSYEESGTKGLRDAFQLRMRLLPYLYTAFADYHHKGIPPFRAMILESGGAATLNTETKEGKLDSEDNPYAEATRNAADDQYMFGPHILVAPYYQDKSESRSVRLPKGKWYCFYTGELVGNGVTITAKGNQTPLFVKEGAVIPMLVETISNTREAYGAPIELRIYGNPETATTHIYEDDGNTFDYLKEDYRIRNISVTKNGDVKQEITGKAPALFGDIEKATFMGKNVKPPTQ